MQKQFFSGVLQVVSKNKSFSVGVQSPTEINAPRGCAVILNRLCQLSLLAHERSRFATCQWELLTPTDISIPLTHRLVLYTLEAVDCLFFVQLTIPPIIPAPMHITSVSPICSISDVSPRFSNADPISNTRKYAAPIIIPHRKRRVFILFPMIMPPSRPDTT